MKHRPGLRAVPVEYGALHEYRKPQKDVGRDERNGPGLICLSHCISVRKQQ